MIQKVDLVKHSELLMGIGTEFGNIMICKCTQKIIKITVILISDAMVSAWNLALVDLCIISRKLHTVLIFGLEINNLTIFQQELG